MRTGSSRARRTTDELSQPASLGVQQRSDGVERIGVFGFLVRTPSRHARKADSNAGAVARTLLDALKSKLEDKLRPDGSDGSELLDGVASNERIHLMDLFVGESGVGLGEG